MIRKGFDPHTPGLVIKNDGSIVTMKDENHSTFFQNIIGSEYRKLGINARSIMRQNNLSVLMQVLLDQLNVLPYIGCESETRIYNGGILYINELDKLSNDQLLGIINVYSTINDNYDMVIINPWRNNEDDKYVSIDEVTKELNKRSSLKKRNTF